MEEMSTTRVRRSIVTMLAWASCLPSLAVCADNGVFALNVSVETVQQPVVPALPGSTGAFVLRIRNEGTQPTAAFVTLDLEQEFGNPVEFFGLASFENPDECSVLRSVGDGSTPLSYDVQTRANPLPPGEFEDCQVGYDVLPQPSVTSLETIWRVSFPFDDENASNDNASVIFIFNAPSLPALSTWSILFGAVLLMLATKLLRGRGWEAD